MEQLAIKYIRDNHVSGQKEFTTPFQANEFAKYVEPDGNILDIGCGYGRTLNELYQNGYRNLIGMDFSNGMIYSRLTFTTINGHQSNGFYFIGKLNKGWEEQTFLIYLTSIRSADTIKKSLTKDEKHCIAAGGWLISPERG
ncbi:MAG: class I SAM-dependent methyltransferase [Clostridium sp.]|nr:class I SAM-dependent methyltransferase [Clostridium sp.]